MKHIQMKLEQAQAGKVCLQESLKYHTTWKIGGPADLLVEPKNKESLMTCIQIIHENNIPFTVIGKGSNLLVRDKGIRGAVVKLGEGFCQLEQDDHLFHVGAGYSMIRLAAVTAKKGWSGLEFAGGIPGSVGGAVCMNAGAHGSDTSKVLKAAHILFADGHMETLDNEQMQFDYRTSILQKRKGICLQATFELASGDPQQITQKMNQNKNYRRRTQPLQEPCCGSVFRNPVPHSAGQLIEQAGLKGFQIGDAQISPKHANFIVNVNQASAQDVLDLIKHIKAVIKATYDIDLQTEVRVAGEE